MHTIFFQLMIKKISYFSSSFSIYCIGNCKFIRKLLI